MQETYLQYDPENPDAYDGDIDADTEEFFEMYMGMGIDAYQEVLLRQAKLEKLYDASIEGVVAEESEVQALYEEKLQEQKDAASSSETEYETLTAGDSGSVGYLCDAQGTELPHGDAHPAFVYGRAAG